LARALQIQYLAEFPFREAIDRKPERAAVRAGPARSSIKAAFFRKMLSCAAHHIECRFRNGNLVMRNFPLSTGESMSFHPISVDSGVTIMGLVELPFRALSEFMQPFEKACKVAFS
jgi:hypothetical protein